MGAGEDPGWNDHHHDQRALAYRNQWSRWRKRCHFAGACRCRGHQPSQEQDHERPGVAFLRELQEVEVHAPGRARAGAAGVPPMRISHGGRTQALGGRGDQGRQEAGEEEDRRGEAQNKEGIQECQSGLELRQNCRNSSGEPGPGAGDGSTCGGKTAA